MRDQLFHGVLLRGGNSLAQQRPDELVQARAALRGVFPALGEQVIGDGQGYIFHIAQLMCAKIRLFVLKSKHL